MRSGVATIPIAMPELPEVETARRIADGTLTGHTIVRATVSTDPIVFDGVSAKHIRKALNGSRVVGTGRKGKHLWLQLDRRPWPCFHLGMTGRFLAGVAGTPTPPWCKLALDTDAGTQLLFINKRRLGRVRLREDPAGEPPISDLGFDALDELPDVRGLRELMAKRKAPVKAVLLDQGVLSGIGNWIADEILYQARIAPSRPAASLGLGEVANIRRTTRRILQRAVDVDADADRFPRVWLFHHRWGKNHGTRTARGEAITFSTVAGRTTAWVPEVQA